MALVAVCIFWGTTYTAIRMALECFPPLFIVSVRFILSGGVMLLAAWWMGVHIPRGRELWQTSLYGLMTLAVGNTALVSAEQWIPSGIAALFITTSPFWLVGIEMVLPGGKRPGVPMIFGMTVGFVGTALLAVRGLGPANASTSGYLLGFLVLQASTLSWSLGSLLQRRQDSVAHPVTSGAVQQLATGLFVAVLALVFRQPVHAVTARGVWAVLYLAVFGSVVGYSAFIYAMDKLPVPIVSIYTYVNPVVAVILGWLVFREEFGLREAAAMAIIFLGVALVKRYSSK
jgi:drug/metabolite transporter (DMT)-like permease